MSGMLPLTLLTLQGNLHVFPAYQQRPYAQPYARIAGMPHRRDTYPPPPSSVTPVTGDDLPDPAPLRFELTLPSTSLRDAYTTLYAMLPDIEWTTRLAWHGGACEIDRLMTVDAQPAGPTDLLVTLDLLPATAPTPWPGRDERHLLTTGWAGPATHAQVLVANASPALTRPYTVARATSKSTSAPQFVGAYLPRVITFAGTGEVDVLLVARATAANGSSYGPALSLTDGTTETSVEAHVNNLLMINVDAFAVMTSYSPGLSLPAGAPVAIRVHTTTVAGGVRYDARAWPAGQAEPSSWQMTATRSGASLPTRAGINSGFTAGTTIEALVLRMAEGGVLAPSIRL